MSVIKQNVLCGPQYPQNLTVHHLSAKDAAGQFTKRLSTPGTDVLPIGIAYYSTGKADFMCLAQWNVADVLLISLGKSKVGPMADFLCEDGRGLHPLASRVRLVGFGMAQTALRICLATNLRVKGVDLLADFKGSPLEFIVRAVGNNVNKSAVRQLWMSTKASAQKDAVLRAWLAAACVEDQCKEMVIKGLRLDTANLTPCERTCLSRLVVQSDLLEKIKPREVKNDFSAAGFNKEGKFQLHNERFKTRVRLSGWQTRVIMTDKNSHQIEGTATKAKGKITTITMKGKLTSSSLRTVKVVGIPDPTNSENARDELIQLVLAGKKSLQESSFIQRLWFPDMVGQTASTVNLHYPKNIVSPVGLNDSQCTAMRAMVGKSPIVIVHGPPGTGKTTTITAAAQEWDSRQFPVWIVAHSNVAVKNIAEKLFDKEVNFKILVSKEFHEEWHEHIYRSIEKELIRSDELPKDKVAMARLILDSKVILCTLSTMLNPKLRRNGTFSIVPPRCLVIDEASQINAFEFMPVFDAFRKDIEKICFFGDPWQLPPFGHDDVPDMKTIFDFKHLNAKKDTYFLNTQYRMPNPIAEFISHNVYEGRLLSKHSTTSPASLAFIDVPRTGEKSDGNSTKNVGEVETVVYLVRNYYHRLDFCVITPYDAQRAAIQKALKDEGLPCETVFNVDSFQGNEAEYVIVSLVRSARPGFLSSVRRMNVMLTRCRRGLIIVSSQAFLGPGGKGFDTLLGKLVQHWQTEYAQTWVDWNSVLNASVDLPGITRPKTSTRRPPRKAEPKQKLPSKGDLATSSTTSAQAPKKSRKSTTSNTASKTQPQQTKVKKDTKKQQSNSRNTTKAQCS